MAGQFDASGRVESHAFTSQPFALFRARAAAGIQ
jgi:hypothetical protein